MLHWREWVRWRRRPRELAPDYVPTACDVRAALVVEEHGRSVYVLPAQRNGQGVIFVLDDDIFAQPFHS